MKRMNKMRIGIITFQETNNYGALWQNYALLKALNRIGADAETIDYRSRYIARPYRWSHLRKKGIAGYLFGLFGYIFYLFRIRGNKRFRKRFVTAGLLQRVNCLRGMINMINSLQEAIRYGTAA